MDESLVFDPTDLAEEVTPAAALKALGQVGWAGGSDSLQDIGQWNRGGFLLVAGSFLIIIN